MKFLLALTVLFAAHFADAAPYCQESYIRCESRDHRPSHCRVADGYNWTVDRRGSYLARKVSHADCREGRDYRFTREGVRVDNGCRGDFRIVTCQRW